LRSEADGGSAWKGRRSEGVASGLKKGGGPNAANQFHVHPCALKDEEGLGAARGARMSEKPMGMFW